MVERLGEMRKGRRERIEKESRERKEKETKRQFEEKEGLRDPRVENNCPDKDICRSNDPFVLAIIDI